MKRAGITLLVLVGVGGLIALLNFHPKSGAVGASTAGSTATSPAAGGSSASTAYRDGTYTGTAVDNAYGTVQVQAVVAGGKLTQVNFLQMPNDQDHSQEVTAAAEPILLQEAIAAQSAQVDTVSGATEDSQSFVESLQAALSQARA